jgi:Transcriptional Coactivator p15 (PC4)
MSEIHEPIEIAKFWKSARNRKQSIVVAIKSYEGHTFLDCRLFGTNAEGQSVPTAKGVTISMARLEEFSAAITKSLAKARELGLLDGESEASE